MTISKNTKFKAGVSGNPKGRPPKGQSVAERLRCSITDDIDEVLASIVSQAKGGDLAACRLLIERVLPAIKPIEMPVPVPMPQAASIVDRGEAVLDAVSSGLIAPMQGGALLAGLGTLSKLKIDEEIEARLIALESHAKERK